MVEFTGGVKGMALNLERDNVGVVIFGDDRGIIGRIEIIQHYLALTKYMIDDHIHRQAFPFRVSSFEMLYQNVKSKRWEEDDTVYFQEGVAMTLFEAYMSRGWRDALLPQFARTPIITTTIN